MILIMILNIINHILKKFWKDLFENLKLDFNMIKY